MKTFYRGDAIEMMKRHIPDHSIDLIFANPPFDGATKNSWDKVLNWSEFFTEAQRILKSNGNLVLHCSVPFNYTLIRAAPKPPTYSWYWLKDGTTNPLLAKVQPLRNTEEILVWKMKGSPYYPQRIGTEERTFRSHGRSSYYGGVSPQPLQTVKGKYQTHRIEMARKVEGFSTRPRELIELIYNSYTKAGDTVYDPFCYNGISSTCCPGRRWIGTDLIHIPKYLIKTS